MANTETQSILVVGGGMSGLTTAIEAAEAGYDTYIVEKNPYLGGRVAQLHNYFPKLCPPYCGLEINFRRIKQNPKIRFFTMAEVESISGEEGNFDVKIRLNPRYVNEKCTGCGECAKACTMEIENQFNYGMDKIKAAYMPHAMAFPMRYVIDPALVKSDEAQKVKDACPYDAVDLDMEPKTMDLKVGAVVWATGWHPYDAAKLDTYGFNEFPNVITNVMMDRLAALSGPTEGKIIRPSDGKAPETIGFIQCAGSRDENHLPYCSGICCLASMKQATYVREQYPDAKIYIFYIDIRATDRLEEFYYKIKQDENIEFFKGKVAKITEDESTKGLILKVEDTTSEELREVPVDMAVLATGMQPNTAETPIPVQVPYDDYGFVASLDAAPGIYAAGCIRTPNNVSEVVQDGTAAALKAIQSIARR
ncbi:MAG: CoB--CoM heterodisulfide reductase iron-sulfur subunit A family protein [Deltaproteobacteria bacterium]|nr:CoB--CoM heterodisulfide reductase iron-sulfur subunit A family protein [Deltaproteobacteria bacterium]MBW2051216.1 CoB--CoM heterodisulfide reductase iron-sulfur subunit A family protein [Deltaproteobacteria bacterium]MBW2139857.1 CoB--CoM heterodisulfide reductase iron-sulfur subunit A family protein [Deltaproteobacteria bacterium]MBW2322021.1 CoB--CoM heterodisulfide reductase iron-sulfur subunit A family protein [Deltaproteobacteria bacterium]